MSTTSQEQRTATRRDIGFRTLVMAASFIVIVAGLKAASSILLPVLVAAFLVVLSVPPIAWLARHRVPTWAATLIVFMVILGAAVGVSVFVGKSVADVSDNLDEYQASLSAQTAALFAWMDRQAWTDDLGIEISRDTIVDKLDAGKAVGLLGDAISALSSMLSNTVFVLLTVVFLLAEAAGMPDKLKAAFGTDESDLRKYGTMLQDLQGYLAIKTWVSLATGVMVAVPLWIMGIDYPVLWGLLAFLLNYIPTLGSIIAAVPPALLAVVQFGWERALVVVAIYVAVNMLMGNVVEPRLLGKRLGLSTLVVFLSLVFWGYVWGPVGMVLCVPLTMVAKLLLQTSDELRWISIMLGSGAESRDELRAAGRAEGHR